MQLYTNNYFEIPEIKDSHYLCHKVMTTEARHIENCQTKLAVEISEKEFKNISHVKA